ncbi:type I polyketide synthase [Shimazuella alba]|uniref:Acyltransferase domain-containing protein n=1 Tax=Shimazuella alba TaxID=2690964 RepID=A0A6I4VVP2_9BACL|nr:acyltransferase domain-containing protein [Shimazuella alba]
MTKDKLVQWLRGRVAESLYLSPDDIKVDEPLEHYGLGSKDNLLLSGELEDLLERELPHTILWDYPTIDSLTSHLVGEGINERSSIDFSSENEAIAIIGIGCRFPGANSPAQFWKMLLDGKDQITKAPVGRWPSIELEKNHICFGGFLPRIDQFDPAFFGISPREAELMDPQQRMLLEVTWEALEDAGLKAEKLKGTNTSVYMGVSGKDYTDVLTKETDFHYLTGNSFSIVANRISYLMDWYGPSMSIDTACSSSLVAVDLACQSLRRGQSSLAFVGGVNLMVTPSNSIRFASGGALALDGKCKTFDISADGYVRGEGAGVIVLKPLSQAIQDKNQIYAVIHGSAVNQDGRSNGLTAPNVQAQKALLRSASNAAGVKPSDIYYVEAHGTGTPLGDPIEVRALAEVYASDRREALYIGSVKTNIGHLEAAAGIAGVIKTALSFRHKCIPPHLNFEQWNPQIPVDNYPLEVVTKTRELPERAYIGVSSFGFGGTNAHVILGESPSLPKELPTKSSKRDFTLLPLSARSNRSLQTKVSQYKHYLKKDALSFDSVAADAWFKRDHHNDRMMIVAKDIEEAIELLSIQEKNQKHDQIYLSQTKKAGNIVFVFSGQGPKISLKEDLFESDPVFQQTILEVDRALPKDISWSLLEGLTFDQLQKSTTIVETQILSFAIQIALAKMWISWGIKPSAVVGHSLGEVAAAYIAGALDLEDAINIVIHRSQCAEKMVNKGRLLVVQVDKTTARDLVDQSQGRIAISVYNSPTSHVLSGDITYLTEIKSELEAKGVFARFIETLSYPSHSFYMQEIEAELYQRLSKVRPTKTSIPFVSTVTGNLLSGDQLDAKYWCNNICKEVLFQDAIQTLFHEDKSLFLEISVHPTLIHPMLECAEFYRQDIQVLPSLQRGESSYFRLLSTVAEIYCNGLSFDWNAVMGTASVTGNSLPIYPWDHQRYWIDSDMEQEMIVSNIEEQDILKPQKIDEYITSLISTILKIPVSKIPLNKPITHLGLDSILAMRLKSKVEQDLNVKISIVPILQGCSLEDLIKSISR